MDYGLMICQANGRPIMTEHLNKRFKDILVAMNDPDIPTEDIVFHSIRHTSAGLKLKLSKGDLKAVQGDGGWNTPDMVTKRYAHILDEDRRNLATEMEARFYQEGGKAASVAPAPARAKAPAKAKSIPKPAETVDEAQALDVNTLAALLAKDTSLLVKVLQFVLNILAEESQQSGE